MEYNPILDKTAKDNSAGQLSDSIHGQTRSDVADNVHKYNLDDQSQPPISHHVHRDNEPLPGAAGAAPTFDYSPEFIENANIPSSEIGTTPITHQTDSPSSFIAQEQRTAPVVPGTRISPYERSALEDALNSTSRQDEFDRNPLKTPDQQYKVHQNPVSEQLFSSPAVDESLNSPSNLDLQHNKVEEQARSAAPFVPSPVAITEDVHHDSTDRLDTHHAKADQQAKSGGPFVPSHVGKTEGDRSSSVYDIDGQPKAGQPKAGQTNAGSTKPSIGDKIIGATEKVVGKIARKSDMQEKGDARAHGSDNTGVSTKN